MTAIYLEVGAKKAIAAAIEWPGWCRSGKTVEAAQQALSAVADRYAVVAARAGQTFAPDDLQVVAEVAGNATTDFGAPAIAIASDMAPRDVATARRHVALLQAAWDLFDVALAESPAELRVGPRGGGRMRDEIAAHVVEAERMYARKVGVRHKPFSFADGAALAAHRAAVIAVLAQPTTGESVAAGDWPQAYATRRITWHVVDHLWELEDRR